MRSASGGFLAGVEPAFVLSTSDSDLPVGELDAAGGASPGAPLVEGRSGDTEFVAELLDGELAVGLHGCDYSFWPPRRGRPGGWCGGHGGAGAWLSKPANPQLTQRRAVTCGDGWRVWSRVKPAANPEAGLQTRRGSVSRRTARRQPDCRRGRCRVRGLGFRPRSGESWRVCRFWSAGRGGRASVRCGR